MVWTQADYTDAQQRENIISSARTLEGKPYMVSQASLWLDAFEAYLGGTPVGADQDALAVQVRGFLDAQPLFEDDVIFRDGQVALTRYTISTRFSNDFQQRIDDMKGAKADFEVFDEPAGSAFVSVSSTCTARATTFWPRWRCATCSPPVLLCLSACCCFSHRAWLRSSPCASRSSAWAFSASWSCGPFPSTRPLSFAWPWLWPGTSWLVLN